MLSAKSNLSNIKISYIVLHRRFGIHYELCLKLAGNEFALELYILLILVKILVYFVMCATVKDNV